ncbi:hypothetical protein Tco_0896953 [Tanacetum coccineum]
MMVQPNQQRGCRFMQFLSTPHQHHYAPPSILIVFRRNSQEEQRKDTAVTQQETYQIESVPTPSNIFTSQWGMSMKTLISMLTFSIRLDATQGEERSSNALDEDFARKSFKLVGADLIEKKGCKEIDSLERWSKQSMVNKGRRSHERAGAGV